MSDWLDEALPEDALVPTTVKQETMPTKAECEDEYLQEIESKLLTKHLEIVESVPGWTELDPDDPSQMPDGWIEKYGEQEATRRHRIAQAALLSPSKAPFGIHSSEKTVLNILKHKSEKKEDRPLNVNIVNIPIDNAQFNYQKIEVDND
jgi:hypothetical protein